MVERELVLLDTDVGSNIDDTIALAYLLSQPPCKLLGEVWSRTDGGLLDVCRTRDAEALSTAKPVILHDPLTAVTIVDEELCSFQRGEVRVHGEGRSRWRTADDGPHEVALEVDIRRFYGDHLSLIDRRETKQDPFANAG